MPSQWLTFDIAPPLDGAEISSDGQTIRGNVQHTDPTIGRADGGGVGLPLGGGVSGEPECFVHAGVDSARQTVDVRRGDRAIDLLCELDDFL